jgi:hypothetical protein
MNIYDRQSNATRYLATKAFEKKQRFEKLGEWCVVLGTAIFTGFIIISTIIEIVG